LSRPKRIYRRLPCSQHVSSGWPDSKSHVESRDMESRDTSNQTGGSFSSRYHVCRGVSGVGTCALAGKRRRDGNVMVVVEEYGADVALKRHGRNFGSRPVPSPPLLSSHKSGSLSPHGRFRLSLVRHRAHVRRIKLPPSWIPKRARLSLQTVLGEARSDQI
jgi:hypothetical protein